MPRVTKASLIARIAERREQLIQEHGLDRSVIGTVYDADILRWQSQLAALYRLERARKTA
jgi:hypothetical protein